MNENMNESTETAVMPTCCQNCDEPVGDMEHIVNGDINHVCPLVPFNELEMRGVQRDVKISLGQAIDTGRASGETAPHIIPGCQCRRCETRRTDSRKTAKVMEIVK